MTPTAEDGTGSSAAEDGTGSPAAEDGMVVTDSSVTQDESAGEVNERVCEKEEMVW